MLLSPSEEVPHWQPALSHVLFQNIIQLHQVLDEMQKMNVYFSWCHCLLTLLSVCFCVRSELSICKIFKISEDNHPPNFKRLVYEVFVLTLVTE